jgi:membrane protein
MKIGEYTSIPRYYAAGIYRELHNKDIFLWAQAIAFKVLVTFVPLVLLGTGLVAQTIRPDQPALLINVLIENFFPVYKGEELVQFLAQLQRASGTITLIGVIGLSITGLTLFGTVRAVLANIFREEWHEHRSVWRAYAFDFRMGVQVGAFFILTIAVTLIIQSLDASVISMLQDMGYSTVGVEKGLQNLVQWVGWLVPLVLSMVMFFQLIYFTPIPHPPARSAWVGAFVAAVLWEVAKVAFTVYATRLGAFQKTWFSALGSTFILILALVLWAYYSGLVLNIGAIATLLHERKHRYRQSMLEAQTGGDAAAAESKTPPGVGDAKAPPVIGKTEPGARPGNLHEEAGPTDSRSVRSDAGSEPPDRSRNGRHGKIKTEDANGPSAQSSGDRS